MLEIKRIQNKGGGGRGGGVSGQKLKKIKAKGEFCKNLYLIRYQNIFLSTLSNIGLICCEDLVGV